MKNLKSQISSLIICLFSFYSFSQTGVSINVSGTEADNSAMLDVSSPSKGMLIPRVALLSTSDVTTITSPAISLLVYNTNASMSGGGTGFWFYNGAAWEKLGAGAAPSNVWLTTGNSGTSAGTNFIGTLDAQDFIIKTYGNAATNERFRITSAGRIVVNRNTPLTSDVFSVFGSGVNGAINALGTVAIAAYSTSTNIGVYGENTGTGIGISGYSTSTGAGVRGTNNAGGYGIIGINVGTGYGVYGGNNSTGYAVLGYNSGSGTGVFGQSAGPIAIEGLSTFSGSVSGGIFGSVYSTTGTGVCSVGNNYTQCIVSTSGSGMAATGNLYGLYSTAVSTANNELRVGGYFASNADNSTPIPDFSNWAYIAASDNVNLNYKIQGPGTVSTVVKDLNDNLVTLACPEAPEILFEDYGSAQLVNGKAHITIDPIFAKNVIINDIHPLRVFIQLEGECKGVYVSNKTGRGFDVIELSNGKSNVKFMWHIVANRANEKLANGTISPFADQRFSKAIPPQKSAALKANTRPLYSSPKM